MDGQCQGLDRTDSGESIAFNTRSKVVDSNSMMQPTIGSRTAEGARSPAVAEGPRDAGVPVEILSAVERLDYTPKIACQPDGLR